MWPAMKLNLIFTNDWELFGDGSGDYRTIQEQPLRELLSTFKTHGARLTVFAEVGQQWAHRDLGQSWASEIADRWDADLKNCVREGHDVQLHLHPTWTGARYREGRWQLDFSRWALASLPAYEIREVIRRGRETLEGLLRSENPEYRCLAFRAGAFCIQPEAKTMESIREGGILCDSSVVPGLSDGVFFDFSHASNESGSYWADPAEVCRRLQDGVLEFPVHTRREWESPLLRKIFPLVADAEFKSWLEKKRERLARIYPSEEHAHAKAAARDPYRKLRRLAGVLMRRRAVVLDYDEISPVKFVEMVEQATVGAKDDLTLVALGHAKTIPNCGNVDRILEKLKCRFGSAIAFPTLSTAFHEHVRRKKNG